MNKKLALISLMALLGAPALWAQVTVSVLLDQEQFLPGESIPLKVRIINMSGQTLSLGADTSWLRLSVQATDSFVVHRTGDVPVVGAFLLPPSKMATKTVDVAPYFDLTRPGRYSVVAEVLIADWNQTFTSAPTQFDVVRGTKLWEQAFGVPGVTQPDGSPEVRKYLLQQANYLRSQLRLYVRVTDLSEEHTFRVVPIGAMVSISRPETLLDAQSNLHVLYQSGPRVSLYCVVSPEGTVLKRETREYTDFRPRLSAAEDGSVTVLGGTVLRPPTDASPSVQPTSEGDDQR